MNKRLTAFDKVVSGDWLVCLESEYADLTEGKLYEAKRESDDFFVYLVDDLGEVDHFSPTRFRRALPQEIRKVKLQRFLADD